MRKSTSGVTTAPSGSRTRGKYTLVISDLLPAMLPLALLNAGWKYVVHMITPAKTKIGYGTSSDGNSAKRPKMSVKMPVASSGWSTTQRIPMNVCL